MGPARDQGPRACAPFIYARGGGGGGDHDGVELDWLGSNKARKRERGGQGVDMHCMYVSVGGRGIPFPSPIAARGLSLSVSLSYPDRAA
jgi:hypothetical protein